MLQFSSESIQYSPDQTTQLFTVSNKGQTQVLFKIKTNNIKAIDARPNIGLIPPQSSCKITIKRSDHIEQNVKIQVSYLQCPDVLNKDNFKQLWSKYQKSQSSRNFPVRIMNGNVQEIKEEKNQGSRHVQRFSSVVQSVNSDPNLYETERVIRIKGNEVSQPPINQQPEQKPQPQKQPLLMPIPTMPSMQQQSLSQRLQEQKLKSIELVKKLNSRQNELRNMNQGKELEINKFLSNSACNKIHTNYTMLAILAIVCFALGFYFGGNRSRNQNDL